MSDLITDQEIVELLERSVEYHNYNSIRDRELDALIARLRAAEAVLSLLAKECRECDGGIQHWVLEDSSTVHTECPQCERARAHLAAVRGEGG